jgi:hypothetical protein
MAKKFKIVSRGKQAAAETKPAPKAVKTKAGKGTPGEGAGRFTGATTGLGVTKFQNQTLANNLKNKLSDAELAASWREEFPNAKASYDESTVKGVRGLFNKGKHGNDVPARPIPEFDENGQALPFRGEKSAAKTAAREAKAAPAAPVKKGKTVVAKKTKK